MKKHIQTFNGWKNTRTNESFSPDADSMRAWMILENYHWAPLRNQQTKSLGELYMMGKKTNLLDTLILKESVINESVRMITEDSDLLEAFKMQVIYEFMSINERSWLNSAGRWLFGDEAIDKVEAAWDDFTGGVKKVADRLLDKGVKLWDKTVSSLKSLVENITSIAKKIGETIKKFLDYVWEGIKGTAITVGKAMIGKAGNDLKAIGKIVVEGEKNEASDEHKELHAAVGKSSFVEECSKLSTDLSEAKSRYFKGAGEKAEDVAVDSGEKLKDTKKLDSVLPESYDIQLSMDNVIIESLKGLCSIATEEDMEKLKAYESHDFTSELKLFESDEHQEKSAVVSWLTGLVQWVLSPIGAITEFLSGQGVKLAAVTPSAVARGWKNRSNFIIFPVMGALIGGIVYKSVKIGQHYLSHEPEPPISSAIKDGALVGGAAMVGAVGLAAKGGMTDEAATKIGQLMVGGIIGALMCVILSLFPTVGFVFKLIGFALLLGMTLGLLAEMFPESKYATGKWGKSFLEFYHTMH